MYKLIIVAASAGGKSTLTRYLRKHSGLVIMEMDEELVKLNGGKWPYDDNHRNTVMVPKVTKDVISKDNVIYLSSYVPDELAEEARGEGFMILLMQVSIELLKKRDIKRMKEEGYVSVARYFNIQLDGFQRLIDKGLVDETIDGGNTTAEIAGQIVELAQK